jgi:hypothetical protein
MGMAKSSAMNLKFELMRIYCYRPQHPKGNMTQTPISVSERRLAIARRLYEALVDQDPDRAITLCDGKGRVVTHHYPRPEESSPETAS